MRQGSHLMAKYTYSEMHIPHSSGAICTMDAIVASGWFAFFRELLTRQRELISEEFQL